MKTTVQKIIELSDGIRRSKEIAEIVGCQTKYVQKQWVKYNLPRPKRGPPRGKGNPSWKCGRVIDRNGYVLVPTPLGHPFGRSIGRILEHRLVMEEKLGRYLKPEEVVHHKNACRLDNRIGNLELCENNSLHLKGELKGQTPQWSKEGLEKMKIPPKKRKDHPRVDNFVKRLRSGDVRRQQILLAQKLLGKDSPYLLNTEQYLSDAENQDR